MLQLKIHALALGQSGISRRTFDQLLAFDNKGLLPWVPSRGSVGASGDLAPLAHLCLPLISPHSHQVQLRQEGRIAPIVA
jgi:histidine ammonia-lyase